VQPRRLRVREELAALAQAAFLDKIPFETANLPVEPVIGLVDEA
jgi:hypothetical protein